MLRIANNYKLQKKNCGLVIGGKYKDIV